MSLIPEPAPDPAFAPAASAPAFAPPGPAAPRTIALDYTGSGSEYFGILFINWILTLVTLGIYYAWARARELRFMIGSLAAAGDRFTFHGNGTELFRGILKSWLLFVPPFVLLSILINPPKVDASLRFAAVLFLYLLVLVVVPFAVIGSLRYRASRTTWRGIRFGFDGRFNEFGGQYAVRLLAVFFTAGLAYVHVATWRRDYMLTHARFGGAPFAFDGVAADLFPRYLLCWVLAFPTFGLSLVWFHGCQQAYYWNHTTLAGGRFHSTLTGGDWLGASMINGVLSALTFGLYTPFAYANLHREFFSKLALDGADLGRIRAGESAGSGTGEAAAGLFDVDAGIDIG